MELKKQEVNSTVLVKGTVLIVCKNAGFWVADETGVYVYGAIGDVQVGDKVTVTGK